jgi:hypothetical protein
MSIKETKINFNCIPIKNYTTTVPANCSIFEIQYIRVKHISTGILHKYGNGLDAWKNCNFSCKSRKNMLSFRFP